MSAGFFNIKKGLNLGTASADPSGGATGDYYYNTTNNAFRGYANGAWHDVTTNDSTQTLTNKTLDAASNTISNIANANISATAAIAYSKLNLSASVQDADIVGVAGSKVSGNITGSAANITGTAAILHGGTGQTTASAAFDALSPLTTKGDLHVYSGSTNSRLGVGSDGQIPVADSTQSLGLAWRTLQQGAKNYITYGSFENNSTTGWSLAHSTMSTTTPTAAASAGVAFDSTHGGTSANANLSIAATATGKLAGSYSLQLAQITTASTAGDMLISQAYTIDTEDQAKIMAFKFYYQASVGASNGNFSSTSSNTWAIWIYDVTNAQWIQPAGVYSMAQNSGVGVASGSFQTPSNLTQFQIALVCINASAGAITMLLDDISCGPQGALPTGCPVTDWQSYTPTFSASFGTVTSINFWWRRVGDTMEIKGSAAAGTTTAAAATFTIPSGYTFDTNKIVAGSTLVGDATTAASTVANARNSASVFIASAATNTLSFSNVADGSTAKNLAQENASALWSSGNVVSLWAKVPVSGWGSTTVMSDSADTRVVAFSANAPSGTFSTTPTTVVYATKLKDTHGGYNTGTGVYTVPVSGEYTVSAVLRSASQAWTTGNDGIDLYVYKNGSVYARLDGPRIGGAITLALTAAGSIEDIPCVAGDTLTIVANTSTNTPAYHATATESTFAISRKSGPSAIAATESVNARYYGATATVTSTDSLLTYSTKDFDTHGIYSSGTATIPVTGKYIVNAQVAFSFTGVNSQNSGIAIYKNGTKTIQRYSSDTANNPTAYVNVNDIISCIAGDTLQVKVNSSDTTPTITANNTYNVFSIARIGN